MSQDIFNVLLLTEASIKILIPEISPAMDGDLISRLISIEQNKTIRPLLGYTFYNELLTQVSGSTLTDANEYLLNNYIVMILALSVFNRLVITSSYQVENTGVRKKYSESSELASLQEQSYYRQQIQDDRDFWINEMVKFICDNQADYPLYYQRTDTRLNTADPQRRKYGFGFNISKI